MAFDLPVRGAAERSVLGDAALTEAALASEPTPDGVHAYAAQVLPNPLSAAAVTSERDMFEDLRAIFGEEAGGWMEAIPRAVNYLQTNVTDGPSFNTFLRAAHESLLVSGLSECELDPAIAGANARELGSVVAPVMLALSAQLVGVISPGSSLGILLVANPGFTVNGVALLLGFLEGIGESGLVSATSLANYLEGIVGTFVFAPLHAMCFIAGTVYQVLLDLYGILELVIKAIGFADEILAFACRILAALPGALARLLDVESASEIRLLGNKAGAVIGGQLKADLVPAFDSSSGLLDVATKMATFSFNLGTYFGPLLIDLLLTLTGVGFVEVAIKILGKVAVVGVDVIDWFLTFLRRLFDAIDPSLFDELAMFGGKIAASLTTRLTSFADEAAAAYGIAKEAIDNGFAVIEDALGRERFQRYAGTIFCTLEPT